MDLKNKVVVITGGTYGIGAACAEKMGLLGCKLVLVARNDNPDFISRLECAGVELILIRADIKLEATASHIAEQVAKKWGRVDYVIHSAGGAVPGSLMAVEVADWYAAFDVHVHAAFHLCRALIPMLKQSQDGSILFISSAAGVRGVKNAIAYSVVKGALPQFARALAFELADDGIRVNCVSPGIIRTKFQDFLSPAQVRNNVDNRIPLHREGKPEDVADLIVQLVLNTYITGENVAIDGGLTMRIA